MNQTIEKWLTIAAFAGWIASMGSLVGLAIRSTPPAQASRPAQHPTVSLHSTGRQQLDLPTNLHDSVVEIPLDTSRGYWGESLRARSYSRK